MRIRKSILKKIITEAIQAETHPYDRLIDINLDNGDFSDGDALDHIEQDIMNVDRTGLSPAALKALEDLVSDIETDRNDDSYDLLEYIPKEIKDRFPLAPLEPEQGYDEDEDWW